MILAEILIALILGVIIGIFTGLTPGIHVNLVAVIVVSLSSLLLTFTSPIILGVFIVSLAITHSFLDALPSIYLGAPDAGQELNVLPGHRLLHRGEGHNAIVYTLIGAMGSLLAGVILFPVFLASMAWLAPIVSEWIGYLLIGIMTYMILKDKGKRIKSLTAFLLSGCLGLIVLNGLPNLRQPLFPLLSGLFGFSILLLSLLQKSVIPKQHLSKPLTISNKNMAKAVSAASGMGFAAGFLPGFGSSQAAIIGTEIVGDIGDEGFLTLVGGINTANMLISIGTAYILDKARNGAIVAINQLMGGIDFSAMILFVAVAVIAGGIATILALGISKQFATWIVKVKYNYVVWSIIGFITLLTLYFDGVIGFMILVTATALGLVTSYWNIGKNHLMGCLVLPVILYFVL